MREMLTAHVKSSNRNSFEPLAPSKDGVDVVFAFQHCVPTHPLKIADFVSNAIETFEPPDSPDSTESEQKAKAEPTLDIGPFKELPYKDEDEKWEDCENVSHKDYQWGSYKYDSPTIEDYPSLNKTCPPAQAWGNKTKEPLSDPELDTLDETLEQISQTPGNQPRMVMGRLATNLADTLKNLHSTDRKLILDRVEALQQSASGAAKYLLDIVAEPLRAKPSHHQPSDQESSQKVSVCRPCRKTEESRQQTCRRGSNCPYFLAGVCVHHHPAEHWETLKARKSGTNPGDVDSDVCRDPDSVEPIPLQCNFIDQKTGRCTNHASKPVGQRQKPTYQYCIPCQLKMRGFRPKTRPSGPVPVPPPTHCDFAASRKKE